MEARGARKSDPISLSICSSSKRRVNSLQKEVPDGVCVPRETPRVASQRRIARPGCRFVSKLEDVFILDRLNGGDARTFFKKNCSTTSGKLVHSSSNVSCFLSFFLSSSRKIVRETVFEKIEFEKFHKQHFLRPGERIA